MNWIVRWIVGAMALYLTVFSWSYVQPLAPFLGGKRGLVLDGAIGAFLPSLW